MDDISMIVGELKAFRKDTDRRLEKIEGKVEILSSFRWKVMGMLAASGGIIVAIRLVEKLMSLGG